MSFFEETEIRIQYALQMAIPLVNNKSPIEQWSRYFQFTTVKLTHFLMAESFRRFVFAYAPQPRLGRRYRSSLTPRPRKTLQRFPPRDNHRAWPILTRWQHEALF